MFVAINPAISIFSLSMTKDTYFGAFFILFILEICNLTSNTKDYLSKKINWFKFITFTLIMCLLRNNAIYVFILFIPILFIFLKNYWKKMIPLLIIPLMKLIRKISRVKILELNLVARLLKLLSENLKVLPRIIVPKIIYLVSLSISIKKVLILMRI